MSENEMNEPTGAQPAAGAEHPHVEPTGNPAGPSAEAAGWRPQAEAAPAPVPPPYQGVQPEHAPWTPQAAVPETPASAPPSTSAFPATAQYPQSAPPNPYAAPVDYTPGASAGYAPNPYAAPTSGDPSAVSYAPVPYAGDPGANYPTAGASTSSYPVNGAQDTGRRGRGAGTFLGLGLLAILLAAGGGIGGAALMHHYDKNDTITVTRTGGVVVSNAPIIDRSSLASIASAVSPSVVSINTQDAEGSGVILSADGYILTNNHVAATASGQSVDITFSDGSTAKATLVGTDPKTDLAVFKAENVSKLTAAKFGNSSALQVGDTVLAIGSPLGLDGSVTAGIVSALNRTIDETSDDSSPQDPTDPFGQSTTPTPSATAAPTIAGAIQTDAAINPGNSGGALVNTSGEVVGINTAIATNGADGNIGVGFSIPSNRAKEVATDIINGTAVSHPQLGVSVSTATGNAGAQVSGVTSGSAAATAGLKTGDVINSFNGQAVHTSDDLLDDIQSGTVGKSYSLGVVRSGQTMTINVTLQESK